MINFYLQIFIFITLGLHQFFLQILCFFHSTSIKRNKVTQEILCISVILWKMSRKTYSRTLRHKVQTCGLSLWCTESSRSECQRQQLSVVTQ